MIFFIMKDFFDTSANRPRKRSNSMVNRWMQIVMEMPKRIFVIKWKFFLQNQFWLSWVLNHQIHTWFNLVCPSQGQFLTFHIFFGKITVFDNLSISFFSLADQKKEEGNQLYLSKNYREALQRYNEAISKSNLWFIYFAVPPYIFIRKSSHTKRWVSHRGIITYFVYNLENESL